MDKQHIARFQKTVWIFYKKNQRSFPWRETTDPYHILVSEIMLQQTQAPRVVNYYTKWLKRFPTIETLAKASFSEIYPYWQGLGYNRRALALQKLAKTVTENYNGILPKDIVLLEALPGIGPYTARAVNIFSYNRPLTCIETNIRRVFIHHFFPTEETVSDQDILPLLELALPVKKSRQWHWALMDYGAYLKGSVKNPNRRAKNYSVQSTFEGSPRQVRGAILKALAIKPMTLQTLVKTVNLETKRVEDILPVLLKEEFIKQEGKKFYLT